MLYQLVLNAINFNHADGYVKIEATEQPGQVTINVDDSGGVGQLFVDDSGDAGADVVAFTSTTISGAAPAVIGYNGTGNLRTVQLALGTGGDTVKISGTNFHGYQPNPGTDVGPATSVTFGTGPSAVTIDCVWPTHSSTEWTP